MELNPSSAPLVPHPASASGNNGRRCGFLLWLVVHVELYDRSSSHFVIQRYDLYESKAARIMSTRPGL